MDKFVNDIGMSEFAYHDATKYMVFLANNGQIIMDYRTPKFYHENACLVEYFYLARVAINKLQKAFVIYT